MPFVQNSFIFGERRTNNIGGSRGDYARSVRILKNFRVLKNGSVVRRAGTELISSINTPEDQIKKAVALEDTVIILTYDGFIKLSSRDVFKDIPILSKATTIYNVTNTSTSPLGQFQDSFGGRISEEVLVNNIEASGNQVWCFITGELPIVITRVERGIEVKPYYASRESHRDYRDLVRAYPMKTDEEKPEGVFFDGSNSEEEVAANVKLVVGANHNLDTNRCEAWFAIDPTLDPDVAKANVRKMALEDYINKPLYFNILPSTNLVISETKTADGVTTNDWDSAATYTTGLLANLNTEAGLSDFSYTKPLLSTEEREGTKTTVIKELLYGRKYMIIPREIEIDSTLTGERADYTTIYPTATVTETAKTTLTLATPQTLTDLTEVDVEVDRLSFTPEQISREYNDIARPNTFKIERIPLIGVDFDSNLDDVDVKWGVVSNGGSIRTDDEDWPDNGDDTLEEDNTQGIRGIKIGNQFIEIREVEIELDAGTSSTEFDVDIDITTVEPVFSQLNDISDLTTATTVTLHQTNPDDVTEDYNWPVTSVSVISDTKLRIRLQDQQVVDVNSVGQARTASAPFLLHSALSIWMTWAVEARHIRDEYSGSDEDDKLERLYEDIIGSLDNRDEKGLELNFTVQIAGAQLFEASGDVQPIYGVYGGDQPADMADQTYRNAGALKAQVGTGTPFNYFARLVGGTPQVPLPTNEKFEFFNSVGIQEDGGELQLVIPLGGTPQANSAVHRLQNVKLIIGYTDGRTNTTTGFIPVQSNTSLYNESFRQLVYDLSDEATLVELFDDLNNGVVEDIVIQFTDDADMGINFPVTDPSPTVTVLAKGFNLEPNLKYIFDPTENPDIEKPLEPALAFDRGTDTRDVLAAGWYKTSDDMFQWFMYIKKTENDIEAEDTATLGIGTSSIILTKSLETFSRAILYVGAKISTEPALPDNTDMTITVDGSLYEFAPARTAARQSLAKAICEIYEIGMPSPAKDGTIRVIGGNDYGVKESTSDTFYSSVDLDFKDADVIREDHVLANKNTVCRVWKDEKASHPVQFLSIVPDDIKDVIRQTLYTPSNFSRVSPDVIYAYFNKSGDNLSDRLTSPQENMIRDYLSTDTFSNIVSYTEKLTDLFGRELTINSIKPSFTGTDIYVMTDNSSYTVRIGDQGTDQSISSIQTSMFKPIAFTNKLTYFNLDNLFVSQVYSRERLGNVESFSGAAQTHLLKDVKNVIYDANRNIYVLLAGDRFISATDFDTTIEGYSRWEFENTGFPNILTGDPIIRPIHLFKGSEDVLFIGSYKHWDININAYIDRLGIFKFDYTTARDAKGVTTFQEEHQGFDSMFESHPYTGQDGLESLFVLNKLAITSMWINADGLTNTIIGTRTNVESTKWHSYTLDSEITETKITLPLKMKGHLGYNTRVVVSQKDFEKDTTYHGFVVGGELAR